MVLGGCTGVGKTAVLQFLRQRGEQVLDLEALANHRGSAFGAMGQAPQPSNETYENVLALAVRRLAPTRRLWVEHEGNHVGKVLVPFGVHAWVRQAPEGSMVVLDLDKQLRVRRLVEDYCSEDNVQRADWVESLKFCISSGLAKKLGGLRVKEALQKLDEGKWAEVAESMLDYYDKLYTRWASQTESGSVLHIDCPTADADANADLVLQALEGGGAEPRAAVELQDGKAPTMSPKEEAECAESVIASTHLSSASCFSGSCFCGEVTVSCSGAPRSVSYCHCSICRRLSGAPFSTQALFSAEQVTVDLEPGAALHPLKTSKGVERQRCASCQSPVQAMLFGGKLIAVPLGLLTDWRGSPAVDQEASSALRPQHHLWYGKRVMDVRDGLPKFVGHSPVPGKRDDGLLPESEW